MTDSTVLTRHLGPVLDAARSLGGEEIFRRHIDTLAQRRVSQTQIDDAFIQRAYIPHCRDLEVVNLHTIYLCEALMQVDSQALLDAAVEFLFGVGATIHLHYQTDFNNLQSSQTPENKRVPEQHLIRSLLISRIDYLELYKQALHRATQTGMWFNRQPVPDRSNHSNTQSGQTVHKDIYCHLGINTLKLIDTLFERNNETIFHTLILKNFYTRGESLLSKNAPKIKLDE